MSDIISHLCNHVHCSWVYHTFEASERSQVKKLDFYIQDESVIWHNDFNNSIKRKTYLLSKLFILMKNKNYTIILIYKYRLNIILYDILNIYLPTS
jgi:hypothetical protein